MSCNRSKYFSIHLCLHLNVAVGYKSANQIKNFVLKNICYQIKKKTFLIYHLSIHISLNAQSSSKSIDHTLYSINKSDPQQWNIKTFHGGIWTDFYDDVPQWTHSQNFDYSGPTPDLYIYFFNGYRL